jgi:hypothetical protein
MGDTAPKLRWYRVTPDRIISGLAVVEGLLALLERLHSSLFDSHTGWPVLIAIATIGAGLIMLLLWFLLALVLRVPFQFSLPSLLVLMVAVAVGCGWFRAEWNRANEQQAIVGAIEEERGTVGYDWMADPDDDPFIGKPDRPPAPTWLRKLLGDCFFADIVFVCFHDAQFDDAWLERIAGLDHLQVLGLADDEHITDAGLKHIKKFRQLRRLILAGTKISDSGLAMINDLPDLRALYLDNTIITDAGLEHVQKMVKLEDLKLSCTRVSDRGLERLSMLTQLRALWLDGTGVTGAGVTKLERFLPQCKILYR